VSSLPYVLPAVCSKKPQIHEKAGELAHEDGISMNSFIVASVSNEVVRQETRDFFEIQLLASILKFLLKLWRRYRMCQSRNQISFEVIRGAVNHFPQKHPGLRPIINGEANSLTKVCGLAKRT
jgi:hypothetical protein